MTALILPATKRASCEAALLFVWTLGLLVPSVMLASGSAAAAGPPCAGRWQALALADRWLSALQQPRQASVHDGTLWCLRWLLVLVCVWAACCVAVDALP